MAGVPCDVAKRDRFDVSVPREATVLEDSFGGKAHRQRDRYVRMCAEETVQLARAHFRHEVFHMALDLLGVADGDAVDVRADFADLLFGILHQMHEHDASADVESGQDEQQEEPRGEGVACAQRMTHA